MDASLVLGGLLSQGLSTGGLIQGSQGAAITTYADPRQGTILFPDNDASGVDPRLGTVLSVDTDPASVDPRQGTIRSVDNDPASVDPRQGTILH